MKVLITGGAGFIGSILARNLLNDDDGKYEILLTDIVEPLVPAGVKWPQKATAIKADILTQADVVVDRVVDIVFMFHGIMSSGAEADFDLGKSCQ